MINHSSFLFCIYYIINKYEKLFYRVYGTLYQKAKFVQDVIFKVR